MSALCRRYVRSCENSFFFRCYSGRGAAAHEGRQTGQLASAREGTSFRRVSSCLYLFIEFLDKGKKKTGGTQEKSRFFLFVPMNSCQSLVVCVSKSRCLRTKVSVFAYQSLSVGVSKSPSLRIASVRPTAFERPPEDGWAPARKPSNGRSTDIRVAKRLIHTLHKA